MMKHEVMQYFNDVVLTLGFLNTYEVRCFFFFYVRKALLKLYDFFQLYEVNYVLLR